MHAAVLPVGPVSQIIGAQPEVGRLRLGKSVVGWHPAGCIQSGFLRIASWVRHSSVAACGGGETNIVSIASIVQFCVKENDTATCKAAHASYTRGCRMRPGVPSVE